MTFIRILTIVIWVGFGLLVSNSAQHKALAVDDPRAPENVPPEIQTLRPGVRLTMLAEHPDLVTPTGIDVDALGNIFVVASHTHFRPDNYQGPEHDEVLVFDGNGENRRVFYNRTTATMDLELGDDGWVYLAQRDRILRIRDTDQDGRADVEEDIAVLDTEADYPHNGLAGLAWHPNGDLVFSLGENYWTPWTLTGTDQNKVNGTGEGGIFRCSPDGTNLRRIAKGFWNPFGVCVRYDGEIFAAENDPGARPPCRLLHVVQGGDYGYQRLYGNAPFHPFVAWDGELPGTLPMLHATGEAPCGVVPFGGGLLVPSWANHRIDFFSLRRNGASFAAERIQLVQGSDYFRPTCIVRGDPRSNAAKDAEVDTVTYYFVDWVYTSYELHNRGRLWKLEIAPDAADWFQPRVPEPPGPTAELAEELRRGKASETIEKLFAYAAGKDSFLARAALMELARRTHDWSKDFVRSLPERDRVSAVLALKMAGRRDKSWPEMLLADESRAVRYEALRWIADEQIKILRPQVERMFSDPATDYQLFEACLAAWTTISGNPRAGITDPRMLLERVKDKSATAKIRGYALRLLAPGQRLVTPQLLTELLAVKDAGLTLEVVRTIAQNPDSAGQRILTDTASDSNQMVHTRAEAIAGLASVADRHIPLLLRLANDDRAPVREEALRALRFVTLDENQKSALRQIAKERDGVGELVRAIVDPESLKHDRPGLNDFDAWQKRLDDVEAPVDMAAGYRIFRHSNIGTCSKCHRHSGRGAVVGPDLSAAADGESSSSLLQSLLQPSKDVAPQYFPWAIVTSDGKTFTGFLLRKGGRSGREFYRDDTGRERSFLKEDIEMRRELRTSLMPEGLVYTMTDRELRDVLAFLKSEQANEK